jgi:hypothetical protein
MRVAHALAHRATPVNTSQWKMHEEIIYARKDAWKNRR